MKHFFILERFGHLKKQINTSIKLRLKELSEMHNLSSLIDYWYMLYEMAWTSLMLELIFISLFTFSLVFFWLDMQASEEGQYLLWLPVQC